MTHRIAQIASSTWDTVGPIAVLAEALRLPPPDYLKDLVHVKLHFTPGQEVTLILKITFTPRLVIFRRVNY